MDKVEIKARAKVNITLDVLGKRQDGYHNIKTIMQTIDLYDKIYLKKSNNGISIKTNLYFLPVDRRNLAYKAAEIFLKTLQIINKGVHIDILKKIPVSAGLAGGSTNAAAVLLGMNKLFNTQLSTCELMNMGRQLGADVPYCIIGGTVLAEGIGDILKKLPPMPKTIIVLAKPPICVSTAKVYGQLNMEKVEKRPDTNAVIDEIYHKNIVGVAKGMCNVLENVTVKKYEIIMKLKNIMLKTGALGSIMSGSGPTVFGIFDSYSNAGEAVKELRKVVRDVYSVSTYNMR